MGKEQIKQAQNNTERMQTYSSQMGRYKQAYRSGFYFEAMLIVYSMLEDRLKSMLYYCGVFANRNTLKVYGKVKSEIKELLMDIDIGGVLDTLDEMNDWINYRNEVMHTAMNKNIEALYYELDIQVDKGYRYERFIDSQVKLMKKMNRVRRKMKMQNNK